MFNELFSYSTNYLAFSTKKFDVYTRFLTFTTKFIYVINFLDMQHNFFRYAGIILNMPTLVIKISRSG